MKNPYKPISVDMPFAHPMLAARIRFTFDSTQDITNDPLIVAARNDVIARDRYRKKRQDEVTAMCKELIDAGQYEAASSIMSIYCMTMI